MNRFLEPAPVASIVFVRVIFGLVIFGSATALLLSGWISECAATSQQAFHWYGLPWVGMPPAPWLHVLTLLAGLASLGVCLGLFYRWCAVVLAVLLAWALAADQAVYSNTLYLFSLVAFWLACSPAGRCFALDTLRNPSRRADVAPSWPLWMLRFQIAAVYLYAGVAKLDADWLAGRPITVWISDLGDDPLLGWFFQREWAPRFLAWAGLFFDLTIVPALVWKPTRIVALIAAAAFHSFNGIWFHVFPLPIVCIGLTTLFFEPDWPLRLARRGSPRRVPNLPDASRRRVPRWPAGFLGIYVAVQLLAPMRHHLYDGDVKWNEWGHPFSWRLRARTKKVNLRIVVVDSTGRVERLLHLDDLSPLQRRYVRRNPEGLRQYCRRVGRTWQSAGREPRQIRARVLVALNGRRYRDQVDPRVDLSRAPVTFGPPSWILPGPE